jgi:hypothetical protein
MPEHPRATTRAVQKAPAKIKWLVDKITWLVKWSGSHGATAK